MIVLPYPVIDPIAFQIGNLAIRWYGIAYVLGILGGWRYAVFIHSKLNLPFSRKDIDDIVSYIALGIVIGGRLGHVLFYDIVHYVHKPWEVFFIWQPGMSFHGGFIGVVLAVFFFTVKRRINLWSYGDMVAAVVTIGIFLGRLANFINCELWGRQTDQPWGIIFPGAGPIPRHPSQLYEAFFEGIVLFILLTFTSLKLRWPERKPGVQVGLFIGGYSLFRILIEFVREPEIMIAGMTMGQLLSIPLLIGGVIIMAYRHSVSNRAHPL